MAIESAAKSSFLYNYQQIAFFCGAVSCRAAACVTSPASAPSRSPRPLAGRGEPWLSFFSPRQMTTLLNGHGVAEVRHIAQRKVGIEAMWRGNDALRLADLPMAVHPSSPKLAHVSLDA